MSPDRKVEAPRGGGTPGLPIVNLLIATTIAGILAGVAYSYQSGCGPRRRLVTQAVNSLPALKSFEHVWREREGSYVYSESPADRVRYEVASRSQCARRASGLALQDATENRWTPDGCLWEYMVLEGRCNDTCDPAAELEPCPEPGSCFCAFALPESVGGWRQAGRTRLCIEDTGRQLSHVSGRFPWQSDRRPLGWY